jgi:hypothetical protein
MYVFCRLVKQHRVKHFGCEGKANPFVYMVRISGKMFFGVDLYVVVRIFSLNFFDGWLDFPSRSLFF